MKKNNVKEQTRENLIQAFWKLYETVPLPQVTVKSVTAAAGYNRSTFYQYFDGVADLLEQAEGEVLERIDDIMGEVASVGASEAAMERGLIRCLDECGRELRILLGPRGDPRFQEKMDRLVQPVAAAYLGLEPEEEDMGFFNELASSVVVTTIAYLNDRPEADRQRTIRRLRSYFRGGAAKLLAQGEEGAANCKEER